MAVGEYVTSSAVIATVLRTNPIKLQLLVPEGEAPHITPGMGVSLEGRIPFLDHRVYAFAWSLPMHFKVRDGKSKWLVRRLLARYLAPELIERPKMGFAMPLPDWLRGPLRPWADDLLSVQALDGVPGLDIGRVRAAWSTHCSGRRNMTEQLWPLLSLQAWRRAG